MLPNEANSYLATVPTLPLIKSPCHPSTEAISPLQLALIPLELRGLASGFFTSTALVLLVLVVDPLAGRPMAPMAFSDGLASFSRPVLCVICYYYYYYYIQIQFGWIPGLGTNRNPW